MRMPRRRSFSELVEENKQALLKDEQALEKIEDRLEQKQIRRT